MKFVIICIGALIVLGVIAALATMFTKGGTDAPIVEGRDCSTCNSVADGSCKIGCLLEKQRESTQAGMEKKHQKDNKTGV